MTLTELKSLWTLSRRVFFRNNRFYFLYMRLNMSMNVHSLNILSCFSASEFSASQFSQIFEMWWVSDSVGDLHLIGSRFAKFQSRNDKNEQISLSKLTKYTHSVKQTHTPGEKNPYNLNVVIWQKRVFLIRNYHIECL